MVFHNNPLILKKWNPDVNLIKEDVGNVPVWVKLHGVHVTAFSEDGLSAIATKHDSADVELKDTIMVAMPKLVGEWFYTCSIRVEYEWKPPRCACCKIFGHVQNECPKNIGSSVAKNLKKPSQSPRVISVGPNVEFKPAKQVYRPVSKRHNANTSGDKKKDVEPTKVIERLIIDGKFTLVDDEGKPFKKIDSSGDHDSDHKVESVDNEMASFLASKKVGYGTNSLLEQWKETYENADYDYDPYDDEMYEGHKISNKIQSICENLDIKVRGRRKKYDSEVEVVFDETANLRLSTSGKDRSDKGYGTNSLLEQWRDSYPDNDDYDP
ncbi:putative RNA-directed DNA polymerase [Tanacetum coccineum]